MCSNDNCGEPDVCDSLDMLNCEAEAIQDISMGWKLAYYLN